MCRRERAGHAEDMETQLATLSRELARAVARAQASAVAVHGRPRFGSSGILWQPGVVVTAEHTLQDDEAAVTLPDGRRAEARLAGRDPGVDLAVLRVEGAEAPALSPVSPDSLQPGQIAMVVGRTAETGVNATLGIVSAAGGEFRTWRGGLIDRYVRLDATVYPNSAGGLVIDSEGRAVGLASTVLSRLAPVAITAPTIERTVREILSKGHVARPYLGVGLQPVRLGVIVLSVEPGGPAEAAGVLIGDILTSLDGRSLADTGDVQSALAPHAPGSIVRLHLLRGGAPAELPVTLAERPRRS
jgi:S1-C subfamily serine protease